MTSQQPFEKKTLNKSKDLNFEVKTRAEMSFYMSKLRILCHGCGQCDSPSEGNHRCDVYRLHQHVQSPPEYRN